MHLTKNVVLADCASEEVVSLVKGLLLTAQSFEVKSHIANWKRSGSLSELRRYAKYFGVGFWYFINRKKYHVIVGWQQFYALIYCFFCELLHVKKSNVVMALNYTYKRKSGKAAGIYRWFMGKCLSERYMDFVHVLSKNYADMISNEFNFPRERIIVTPFGINDQYDLLTGLNAPDGYQKDEYALAIGRSNRDFDFLIRVWEKIDYPLVIISDTYRGKTNAAHIKILTDVVGEESKPWISNCALMLIPIDDGTICSGDTVLLTAMSLKRKILVTVPSTLAEMYIIDGENALLSEKEEVLFEKMVREALFSETYENLGELARESFLKEYSRKSMGEKIAGYIKNKCNKG